MLQRGESKDEQNTGFLACTHFLSLIQLAMYHFYRCSPTHTLSDFGYMDIKAFLSNTKTGLLSAGSFSRIHWSEFNLVSNCSQQFRQVILQYLDRQWEGVFFETDNTRYYHYFWLHIKPSFQQSKLYLPLVTVCLTLYSTEFQSKWSAAYLCFVNNVKRDSGDLLSHKP